MMCFKWGIKKIFKSFIFMLPLFVIVAVVIVSFESVRGIEQGPENYLENKRIELAETQEILSRMEEVYKSNDTSMENRNQVVKDMEIAKMRANTLTGIINNYEVGSWIEVYSNELSGLELEIEIVTNNISKYGQELLDVLYRDQAFFEYMKDNNIPYERQFVSTKSFSFTFYILGEFYPILLLLSLLFTLTILYASKYHHKINKSKLVPQPLYKKMVGELSTGIVVAIFYTIFIMLVAFVFAAARSGIGSFLYPLTIYSVDGVLSFSLYCGVLLQTIVLMTFVTVFIVSSIYLVCNVVKKSLPSLLYCGVGFLTFAVIISEFKIYKGIAHLSPFSYLNVMKVLSGELAYMYQNSSVNFSSSVLILGIYSIVFILIAYKIQKMEKVR